MPRSLLLAVSYNESRWEQHGGRPSTSGGYGVMHLTDVPAADARGTSPSLRTLTARGAALGRAAGAAELDPRQNIRGGAALLARYARATTGRLPADPADLYGAVAAYSGSRLATAARAFAGDVYATIRRGAARTTSDGQVVRLSARAVRPNRATARRLHLRAVHLRAAARTAAAPSLPECPRRLACRYIPAAYVQDDPNNPGDYGNYDLADRPRDGLGIRYIVIHDTEETFADTLATFQDPHSYVSAHYVVRSSDGFVAQMVPTRDVAWHAGNWYVNTHSVGIENEGFAIEGRAGTASRCTDRRRD